MSDNTTLNPGAGGDVIASDDIGGAKYQRIKLIHGADGTNAGDVATSNPLPVLALISTNAAQLAAGITANVDVLGELNVNTPYTQVFSDPFDGSVVDVTDRWTIQTAGAGTVTQINGVLSLDSGTTALGYASIRTKQSFAPKNVSVDVIGFTTLFELPLKANTTRFIGRGSVPATPTIAVPVTDGTGFQLDVDGAGVGTLTAAVYANGTKTFSSSIALPGDANQHIYAILYRADTAIFIKDNLVIPVAFTTLQPNVQTLPIVQVAVSGATPPSSGQVMNSNVIAMGDSGKNANQIADGSFPWRTATVKPASVGAVSTDTALVVDARPFATSGTITTQNLVPAGAATASSAVEITLGSANALAIQVTGTYTGALSLQATADGTNWITVGGTPFINQNTAGYLATITSALQSVFAAFGVAGFIKARVTGLAAMTGTATVTIRGVDSPSLVAVGNALPAGANSIGAVTIGSGTVTTVTTVTTCSTLTTLANGQTAHSSAATGSPVRIGARVAPAALDTTLIAGDATDVIAEFNGAALQKPYSSSTFDWSYTAQPSGIVNTTTPVTIKAAAAAGIRNYVTNLNLCSDALGTATEFCIRDAAITASSQTIASNTLTISAAHGLSIGDAVVPSASGVTGLTAGVQVYVLTVPSTTTVTFSATPGGSTLTISGTSVTATLNHIVYRGKLQTAGLPAPANITFPNPLRGGIAQVLEIATVTASTGGVYANLQGYQAP